MQHSICRSTLHMLDNLHVLPHTALPLVNAIQEGSASCDELLEYTCSCIALQTSLLLSLH